MPLIPINKLHADPRNANVLTGDVFEKLKGNLSRTGFYPACIVRPHPNKKSHYILIDGHHRVLALKDLGHQSVECQVVELSTEEAGLLLLTLNRLRGTDIPKKRAELIESLLDTFSMNELSLMLPETSTDIEGLLVLLQQDDDAIEQKLKAQMKAEQESLPVPFGFMIPAEKASIINKALTIYREQGHADPAQALVAICRDVLAWQEKEDD
jgi:ParB-like chromosome segregation protein Spo0J